MVSVRADIQRQKTTITAEGFLLISNIQNMFPFHFFPTLIVREKYLCSIKCKGSQLDKHNLQKLLSLIFHVDISRELQRSKMCVKL